MENIPAASEHGAAPSEVFLQTELETDTTGSYGFVLHRTHRIVVEKIFDDGPNRATLRVGDEIVKVGGTNVRGDGNAVQRELAKADRAQPIPLVIARRDNASPAPGLVRITAEGRAPSPPPPSAEGQGHAPSPAMPLQSVALEFNTPLPSLQIRPPSRKPGPNRPSSNRPSSHLDDGLAWISTARGPGGWMSEGQGSSGNAHASAGAGSTTAPTVAVEGAGGAALGGELWGSGWGRLRKTVCTATGNRPLDGRGEWERLMRLMNEEHLRSQSHEDDDDIPTAVRESTLSRYRESTASQSSDLDASEHASSCVRCVAGCISPCRLCTACCKPLVSTMRKRMRRFFGNLWARIYSYPIFYLAYFAYFLTYFVAMAKQARRPREMLETASDTEAVGALVGFLPNGTLGGAPWEPGHTCLQLPPQYSFDDSALQRALIPLVYAFMHGALTALTIMPLPLCYAFWTHVAAAWPGVRHIIPIDDFVYFHRVRAARKERTLRPDSQHSSLLPHPLTQSHADSCIVLLCLASWLARLPLSSWASSRLGAYSRAPPCGSRRWSHPARCYVPLRRHPQVEISPPERATHSRWSLATIPSPMSSSCA